MPTSRISLLVIGSMIAFSGLAHADRVNNRQHRQQGRIHEGVESGELTKGEAASLRAGQRKVRRIEERAKADGEVTGKEAVRMEKAEDHQSRRIYRQKHDAQKAPTQSIPEPTPDQNNQ